MNLKWANNVIEELRFVNQMFGGFIIGKLVDSPDYRNHLFYRNLADEDAFYPVNQCYNRRYEYHTVFRAVYRGDPDRLPGYFSSARLNVSIFLFLSSLLQQFDGNILGPKILGDSTGLSSFWVLFSILLFGGLFGFVGMIIAVPALQSFTT